MTAMLISSSGFWPPAFARSLCALIRLVRCSAQLRFAGPAPTSRTSISSVSRSIAIEFSGQWPVASNQQEEAFFSPTDHWPLATALFAFGFLHFGGQGRDDLEEVADDAVIGD